MGLVTGLLVIEGGMVLLRYVWFDACGSPGQLVDPVWLAARLREGAAFALIVHLAVFGGLVVMSFAHPSWTAPRFAVWALFAMVVWMTAYMVQGLDRVGECAGWSLYVLETYSQRNLGIDIAVPELLDRVQGQSIVVLGVVFFVAMHVSLCLAILRPAADD